MTTIQKFNTLPEMIAHLGPLETLLYKEFGQEDYLHLMEMYASVVEDNFDEWYDSLDEEYADHIVEISHQARIITERFDTKKMLH